MIRGAALCVAAWTIGAASGVLSAGPEEWSRFRGPNGTGISASTGLPTEFGPAKNVIWKASVPPGHSSPVLTATRIFLTAYEGDKLLVLSYERNTGRETWRREVRRHGKGHLDGPNSPASPSAVTDGKRVYTFFQDAGLTAFTVDGKELWHVPLGPFNISYGFGASPILVDGTVLLAVDQNIGSYLLGVDARTGKTRYRIDRPGVISGYSTPTVYQPTVGPKQILVPESFQLSAYSVADGHRVWWVRGLACEMKSVLSINGDVAYVNGWGFSQNQAGTQIPTVPFEEGLAKYDANKDGRIAATEITGTERMDRMLSSKAGFPAFDLDGNGSLDAKEWDVFRAMLASENGLLAIALGGKGDMTADAVKWKYLRPVPQVPSTLLYRDVLYMVNDSGILIAFDPATGSVLKQGRLKGAMDKYFASPVGGDGKVYLASQDGTVSVVDAKGAWEIIAVNTLDDEVYATPAIADGRIYVRTKSAMYAFGSPQ
jgi:outer membrane protein assembly factor BamB